MTAWWTSGGEASGIAVGADELARRELSLQKRLVSSASPFRER